MSGDYQYIGFMDDSLGYIYKFNSGSSQYITFKNVTLANITYIGFTSNADHIIVAGRTQLKIYTNDGTSLT